MDLVFVSQITLLFSSKGAKIRILQENATFKNLIYVITRSIFKHKDIK